MSNRRFEVFHYRQVLHLMQQNQSDRAIAKSGLMGRQKVSQLRLLALEKQWLEPGPLCQNSCSLSLRDSYNERGRDRDQ
jgi:hypothetical protein